MSASYSGARSAGPAMEAFQPPEDGTFLRRSPLPAYEATLPFLQSSPLAVVVTDAQGRIISPTLQSCASWATRRVTSSAVNSRPWCAVPEELNPTQG